VKEQDLSAAIDLVAKRDSLAKASDALGVIAGRNKATAPAIALSQSIAALIAAAPFLEAEAMKRMVETSHALAEAALKVAAQKLEELGVET